MSKKIIYNSMDFKLAGPYSPAVEANGFVFISGQIPINLDSGEIVLSDMQSQTRLVLDNMKVTLNLAGCSMDDVVKTTIYITDMCKFGEVNEVYKEYFPRNPPARSTVGVANLPKGIGVEIEAIAVKRSD